MAYGTERPRPMADGTGRVNTAPSLWDRQMDLLESPGLLPPHVGER